ncbi:hypothetical protein [Limimaricola sp.]|uniref:hypothetical protein n=1 Tax=Limimaricola sp. TaxID=2211665 RepID=UPI004058427B
MSMDRVTETIAHFIGTFELAGETGRLRAEYDSILIGPAPDEDLEALGFKGLRLAPEHPLEDLDPQVIYQPLPPAWFGIDAEAVRPEKLSMPKTELAAPDAPPLPEFPGLPRDAGPALVAALDMPPPSSLAAMHYMANHLEDADWFGVADAAVVAQFAELPDILKVLADQAMALSPIGAPLAALSEGPIGALDWHALTAEIMETAQDLVQGLAQGPINAIVLTGAEAQGVYVDGVAVDELPDWQDLWPEFLRAETEASDEAGPEDREGDSLVTQVIDTAPDFDESFDRAMEGLDETGSSTTGTPDMPGPLVVTGANQLINEVAITSNWLDAPIIVVEGNALRFDAISQTGIIFDRDGGGAAQGPASLARNAASITSESNPAPRDADAVGKAPAGWALARIEGDLVQVNGLQQYNFASDPDMARIDVASSSLQLGLGENRLENLAVLDQFGWTFDLIIVAKDMVDVNIVRQINLLLDDDMVSLAGSEEVITDTPATPSVQPVTAGVTLAAATEPAADTVVPAVHPMTEQQAPVTTGTVPTTATGPAKATTAQVPSPISGQQGPVTTETAPQQELAAASVASEQDGIATSAAAMPVVGASITGTSAGAEASPVSESTPASTAMQQPAALATATPASSAQPGPAPQDGATTPTAATGSGALPQAGTPAAAASSPVSPKKTELSVEPEAPENLAYNQATIHTKGQDVIAELPKALGQTSAAIAAGAETLGQEALGLDLFDGVDLLKVLLIEGDFTTVNWIDQINVLGDTDSVKMLQDAIAATPGAQSVTGANLLANKATITDLGVDTQIMAKGEAYSDALLHQAGLVEDKANSDAASAVELANEAVAFLADGMLEAGMAEMEAGQAALQANIQSGLDTMAANQADLMQTMLS